MEQLSVDDLVLWRLAKEGLDGITQAELSKAMKAYCPKSAVRQSCSKLVESGLAAIEKGKRSEKYRATSKGLERTREFADPGKVNWQTFQEKHLPAHCLQLTVPTGKSAKNFPDAIRAALLCDLFNLPVKPGASLTKVLDSLLADQLKQPAGTKIAKAILLSALPAISPNEGPVDPPPPEDNLETFASAVTDAMNRTKEGWVGSRVFISRVWDTLTTERRFPGMTLDHFKGRLLEANTQELLTLSRADLAPAYDQADVNTSEIRWDHRTFHFLIKGAGLG